MRPQTRFFRACVLLASTSLYLNATGAVAQPAPPGPAEAPGGGGDGSVPTIAGRLTGLSGGVSFHTQGETQWSQAADNYPVTTGDSFWTQPQAHAEIELAGDTIALDGGTELDVQALDQQQGVFVEPQGAVFLDLPTLPDGQALTVNTPRGAVQITQPGQYELLAGDTNSATLVTVVQGQAQVTGPGLNLTVGANQTGTIQGSDSFQGSVGPLQQDGFLSSMQQELTQHRQPAVLPEQVRNMTGCQDLAQYGSFQQSSDYGQVWYPNNVTSDWAPYREGHWAYVAPWGWTWVDNEPWGFAPFHYGRWVEVDGRWGWIAGAPGEGYPGGYPVYSPAMVSFLDVGGAALAGAALGFAAGALLGWVPLGPREPFYPWYRTGGGYFGRVNAGYGVPRDIISRGPTVINNVHVHNTYINQRAATVAPAAAVVRGESMRGVARPLPAAVLAKATPVGLREPVRPGVATPHLSPAVQRQYNIHPTARPAGAVAPGPQIHPAAAGGAAARPALRPNAMPSNVRPVPAAGNQAGRPGEPAARPGEPANAASPAHPGAPGEPAGRRPDGLPGLRPSHATPQGIAPEHGQATGPAGRGGAAEAPGARAGEAGRAAAPAPHDEEAARPKEAGRGREAGRPQEAAHPAARVPAAAHPAARAHAPAMRPAPQRAAPHVEAPHAEAPHAEAPHGARPAPHPVARPAPHPVARPAPHPRPEHKP